MFYHIKIKTSKGDTEVKLDIDEVAVIENFVKPYCDGVPIFINGKRIATNEIAEFKVSRTTEDSKSIMPSLERRANEVAHMGILWLPTLKSVPDSGDDVTEEFVNKVQDQNKSYPRNTPKGGGKKEEKVFVVHGRNLALRDSMFEFLKSLGLEPMEWEELRSATGKTTPYIGEILDVAFETAQAIIVLLTPDDEARLRKELWKPNEQAYEKNYTFQARPNVLFEAGMAMGREPERTIMIEIGELRPFSDVGGRHTLRMDNSVKSREQLISRLRTAECPVKIDDEKWKTTGDFTLLVNG